MNEYMILIVAEDERGLSPEDAETCITEYGKWAEKLGETHVTARRLKLDSGVLINKNKELITDGPFAESKELIAGIVLVNANSLDQATDIAHSCPLIEFFNLFVKEVHS